MNKREILERLQLFGLSIYDSKIVATGIDIKVLPNYHNNFGFFHLISSDLDIIILKGVYKDFYRILSENCTITESEFATIARALNDSESAVDNSFFELEIYLALGLVYVKDIKILKPTFNKHIDRRDITIPRPLTTSEYIAPTEKAYLDDNIILSTSFLNQFFPDVLSVTTLDIFKKIPDILNPFFTSHNIKTSTPSVMALHHRPYINMSAFESMLNYIKLGTGIFRNNYSTALSIKNPTKVEPVNRKYLPDSYDEIIELITELERKTKIMDLSGLISDEFLNYPAWIAIIYEYIIIELMNCFAEIDNLTNRNKDILKVIYKSRDTNIFTILKQPKDMPIFFDFASDILTAKFTDKTKLSDLNTLFEEYQINCKLFSDKKVVKLINHMHKLLTLRDNLYLKTSDFILKVKKILLQFAISVKDMDKINNVNDIFYFDLDEIKRLYNDTYFGEVKNSVHFRKSQNERFSALLLPSEIFCKDIDNLLSITEQMYTKADECNTFQTSTLFSKDVEAMATDDEYLENYDNKIFVCSKISPIMLDRFQKTSGFIIDSNSIFSYLTEFAALYDIPIHSGIRFAPKILNNKKLMIKNNSVSVKI